MSWSRWLLRQGAIVGGGALVATDTALAWRADAAAPQGGAWLTLVDVAVGLAFVAAAAGARGPIVQRLLVGGVGAVWLAGSWLLAARVVHQGVLVVALLSFPDGRLRGPIRWAAAALAVPVAVGVVRQDGVAAVFLLVAVVGLVDGRSRPAARWYPGLAAVTAAGVLGAEHAWAMASPGSFVPAQATLAWDAALVAIAATFPVAVRRVRRHHRRLADRFLAAAALSGLPGLAAVLTQTLGDPGLRIHAVPDPDGGLAGGLAENGGVPAVAGAPARRWLPVGDGADILALVEYTTTAMDDAATAQAVQAAVRLMAINVALQQEQQAVLAELEASRVRLLAAADLVRHGVAQTLRSEVEAPVSAIAGKLAAARHGIVNAAHEGDEVTVTEALDIVVTELGAVGQEIQALVAGVPPADLGGGKLAAALSSLAHGSPVPVTVRVDGADGTGAGAAAETALFYACSEALANAVKYAAASQVVIEVSRLGGTLEARICDDGRGGADAEGSGLRGLADRMAACGGRLQVVSAPGAGSVITAVVPL